jgi:uncharacterized protein
MNLTAARFIDQAKGSRGGVWRALAGFVAVVAAWLAMSIVVALHVAPVRAILLWDSDDVLGFPPSTEAAGAAALLILGFGPAFLVLLGWRHLVDRKPVATLFSAAARFRWGLCMAAAGVVSAGGLAASALLDPASATSVADRFAGWSLADAGLILAVYAAGFAVQATFEEVFVRGWLLQQVARRFASAAFAVLASALVFMAMHVGHPGWATYPITFAMGIVFAWSALRLDGLEAAIGAHWANNFVSAALFGGLVAGNAPAMTGTEAAMYGLYVLVFVGFVEGWARCVPRPARA